MNVKLQTCHMSYVALDASGKPILNYYLRALWHTFNRKSNFIEYYEHQITDNTNITQIKANISFVQQAVSLNFEYTNISRNLFCSGTVH